MLEYQGVYKLEVIFLSYCRYVKNTYVFLSVRVLVITQQCASIIDVAVLLPLHPSALAAIWLAWVFLLLFPSGFISVWAQKIADKSSEVVCAT